MKALPVMLGVMYGLVVRVSGSHFVLPLRNVVETLRPEPSSRPCGAGRVRGVAKPPVDASAEAFIARGHAPAFVMVRQVVKPLGHHMHADAAHAGA